MITITIIASMVLAILAAVVLAFLRASIRREVSASSLRGEPPTRAASVTRRVLGLYAQAPQRVAEPGHAGERADTGRSPGGPTSAGPR